ncbi:MAG: hypothetical protein JW904_10510 [Spirochaetales bacterium]|nr:hypothetical protein [Spirochaetales bacterium]
MGKTAVLLRVVACILFFICMHALSAQMRIGADGGVAIPTVADIGEQIGLGTGVFRANPGYVFGLSADYSVWQGLGFGADIRYGKILFPDTGADTYDYYQLSLYSFWAFDLTWLTIEPGIQAGSSQVFLTNVQNNIFALATGEGSDFPFISPHVSVNLRIVWPLMDLLGIQVLLQGTAFFAQDIVIPVISVNMGLIFSFGEKTRTPTEPTNQPTDLPVVNTPVTPDTPSYRTNIELSTLRPVLIGTLYFHKDTDAILSGADTIKETISALQEKYPAQKIVITLEGFAVPIGEETGYDLLVHMRIAAAKRVLGEAGIPEDIISSSTDMIGKRELREKEFWPGQRRVDIYFRLEQKSPENTENQ